MNCTMNYRHGKIIRGSGTFRFFFGICTLGITAMSCVGPSAPENVARELSGGYEVVAKLPTTGYAQDVVVADSFAYVTQGQCGVAIVNVGDPHDPRLVSEVINVLPGYSGKLAYLKDTAGIEMVYSANGSYGLTSVEVIDKRNPVVTRPNDAQFQVTMGIFVFKNFIFCSDGPSGIGIGDLSDPKFPEAMSGIPVPGYSMGACVSSDSVYLLCAVGEEGFVMENISNLVYGFEIPDTLSGHLDLPGNAEDVTIKPGTTYAFVACGPAGLQIINYSDTANIKVEGSFAAGGYTKEVCVVGDRAYLATEQHGVQIIDISNVASPRRIGVVKVTDVRGIFVSNGFIYAADRLEGLIIIKIP
jgi:hypothetical protein